MTSNWIRPLTTPSRALAVAVALLYTGTIGLPEPAAAASFTPDTTADGADAKLGDGKCATASGSCTLRAAVQEVGANTLPGEINIPAGTYTLTLAGTGADEGGVGDLDLQGDVTIHGTGRSDTIIDGNGKDRVFEIAPNSTVKIDSLTIRGGKPVAGARGGGVWNRGGLRLFDVAVTGNRTTGDPQVADGLGGGIRNDGKLTLVDVLVGGNQADNRGGGLSNGGEAKLEDATVQGNSSLTDRGGGIENDGTLTIEVSSIEGNTAAQDGGGIDTIGGSVTIGSSVIANNRSGRGGGGIHAAGDLTLRNVTLSGNRAAGAGGGLLADDKPHAIALANVTVSDNEAGSSGGGGVAVAGTATVTTRNSILAGNRSTGGGRDCNGTIRSEGHDLVQTTDGCTLAGAGTGNVTGKDPRLSALSGQGATRVHGIAAGSPAVDAGDPAAPGTGGVTCEAADQRGTKRPIAGTPGGPALCDIGAFEFDPAAAAGAAAR